MAVVKLVLVLTLVVIGLIGFWWYPGLIAFGLLIVWFLADDDLAAQVKGENARLSFRSGVSRGASTLDEHKEFYDHDRQ